MKQFATVTVIGRDKTGVIARVTAFLFEQHANIEALEEQVTRGQFSMTLQASWRPADCNGANLRAGLDRLARASGHGDQSPFHGTEPPPALCHHGDEGTALLRRAPGRPPAPAIQGRARAGDLQPRRPRAARQNGRLAVHATSLGTTAPGPKPAPCACSRNTRLISWCSRAS